MTSLLYIQHTYLCSLVIPNYPAMNTGGHTSLKVPTFTLLGVYPEVGLLHHFLRKCPLVAVPFYLPNKNAYMNSSCSISCPSVSFLLGFVFFLFLSSHLAQHLSCFNNIYYHFLYVSKSVWNLSQPETITVNLEGLA